MNQFGRSFFCIALFCFIVVNFASAQTGRMLANRPPLTAHEQPIIIVDSFTTDLGHLLLRPENIQSIDLVTDGKVTSAYGEKAKNGVLVVRPKKNTKIIPLNDLLDQFNIPVPDRTLNVCVDKILVKDVKKLVVDKEEILSVDVITDICWVTPAIAGPEQRHINIITKRPR
jgi:hypothetical protein